MPTVSFDENGPESSTGTELAEAQATALADPGETSYQQNDYEIPYLGIVSTMSGSYKQHRKWLGKFLFGDTEVVPPGADPEEEEVGKSVKVVVLNAQRFFEEWQGDKDPEFPKRFQTPAEFEKAGFAHISLGGERGVNGVYDAATLLVLMFHEDGEMVIDDQPCDLAYLGVRKGGFKTTYGRWKKAVDMGKLKEDVLAYPYMLLATEKPSPDGGVYFSPAFKLLTKEPLSDEMKTEIRAAFGSSMAAE